MDYETNNDINNYADYMKKYNPTESSALLPFVGYDDSQQTSNIHTSNITNTIPFPEFISPIGVKVPIVNYTPSDTFSRPIPIESTSNNTSVTLSEGNVGQANEMVNYLTSKGLKKEAAAGIVGNLMVESGLKTTASGDKNTSFGLAQWRDPIPGQGRWTNLKNFTSNRGLDINSVNGQLEYLIHELSTSHRSLLNKLQVSTSPEEAAELFRKDYEKPAPNIRMENLRKQHARKFYNA